MITKLFSFFKKLSIQSIVASLVILVLTISLVIWITTKNTDLIQTLLKYTLFIGAIPLWYSLIQDIRKGSFGVDLIAGVALVSTFLIGQYLAGVVVLLMLSGGHILEEYAMRRAKREMKALLSRTPEFVHIKTATGITDIKIEDVVIGMEVIIKPGEIIAVDGMIIEGTSSVDESVLTGESVPMTKKVHDRVFAGTQNTDGVLLVRVDIDPKETKYQSIIELVRLAQESKAPIVRLADTYSVYFTIITFTIAVIAWFISHDVVRVVSVLVVATPCPLILATPIAMLSGMSKSSQRGIIIKDGGALEKLSRVSTFVFDKTGTVTLGEPVVSSITAFERDENTILTLAASLDQLSSHVLARALTAHAREKNISLSYPTAFTEAFGDGVIGTTNNETLFFGKKAFVEKHTAFFSTEAQTLYQDMTASGNMVVFLSTREQVLGAICFKDVLRDDSRLLFEKIKQGGIEKIILLTGDQDARAQDIGKTLGVTEVVSECAPEDKVTKIKELQKNGEQVVMIGDGINDAPALAQADVGIALGSHGKTAASDTADMVILSQSIHKVYDVWHISKKTVGLAKNGIFMGIGLSTITMIFSVLGYIQPVGGALLQEVIDIIVIINALRLGSILKQNNTF